MSHAADANPALDDARLHQAMRLASQFTSAQLLQLIENEDQPQLLRQLAASLLSMQEEYLPGAQHNLSRHDSVLLQSAGRYLSITHEWQSADKSTLPVPDLQAWENSALLQRLQAGKTPLPYPPPTMAGQPWYELIEQPGVYPVTVNAAQGNDNPRGATLELNGCLWQVVAHLLPDGNQRPGIPPVLRDDCQYIIRFGRWPDFLLYRGRTANRCAPEYAQRLHDSKGDDLHPNASLLADAPDENGWLLLEYDHWLLRERFPVRAPESAAEQIAADRNALQQYHLQLHFPISQLRFEDRLLEYQWNAEHPALSTIYRVRETADRMRQAYPELAAWSDKALAIAAADQPTGEIRRNADFLVQLYEYEQHAPYLSGTAHGRLMEARFMHARFHDSYLQKLVHDHLLR